MYSDESPFKIYIPCAHAALLDSLHSEPLTKYYFEGGHIKEAASALYSRAKLAEFSPPKGKFMIHAIGMGSTEMYGFNRNGDAFGLEGLIKRANTFVTNGHMFREHRNRDPKLSIGEIKAAAVHPTMQRVELILWADCNKAAEEYEMAKQGKDLAFSMSCRVPYDRCNVCQNKARSPKFYCDHAKYRMTQYIPEMEKYAFVHNDDPKFFDMSRVGRGAERIAFALEVAFHDDGTFAKAASHGTGEVINGFDMAEMLGLNPAGENLRETAAALRDKQNSIRALVKEAKTDFEAVMYRDVYGPFYRQELQQELPRDTKAALGRIGLMQPGAMFNKMARAGVVLTLPAFAELIFPDYPRAIVKQACCEMGDAFARLAEAADDIFKSLPSEMEAASDLECNRDPRASGDGIDQAMDDVASKFSHKLKPVQRRITLTISKAAPPIEKSKADEDSIKKARALADGYAIYQMQALSDIRKMGSLSEDEFKLAEIAALAHNAQL